MPLCIITEVTSLNTSFFVGFAFLSSEQYEDYDWVLEQLKKLYQSLRILNPLVIATDCEVALINVIAAVFPNAQHLLCM
jgi:beta-glucosidase-like glycosyl hydrolase